MEKKTLEKLMLYVGFILKLLVKLSYFLIIPLFFPPSALHCRVFGGKKLKFGGPGRVWSLYILVVDPMRVHFKVVPDCVRLCPFLTLHMNDKMQMRKK